MKAPDSNLNPDSQPWARWREDDSKALWDAIAQVRELAQQAGSANSDPTVGVRLAEMQAQMDLTLSQLVSLYTATGTSYPPGGAPVAPTPPPPATIKVFETRADWSRTWGTSSFYTGSDYWTNGSWLYQGSNPENKVGMFHFNTGPVRGRKFKSVSVYMANIDAPWSTVFTATLGTHGNATPPAGKPGRQNGFDVGWARGEAKWFPVPTWAWGAIGNGSIQGFTVGASGPSNANSAIFKGAPTDNPPKLRIEYYA